METRTKVVIPAIAIVAVFAVIFLAGIPVNFQPVTIPTTEPEQTITEYRGRNPEQLYAQAIGWVGIVTVEARHPDGTVFFRETNRNLLVDEGKEFLEDQVLATSGIASNGANYIALSNDGTSPTAGETTCDTEITANGLERAQGTVADTGTGTNTITETFTATGSQSAQKTCLFTDVTSGEPDTLLAMVTFTQVNLATNDQLTVEWTVTFS